MPVMDGIETTQCIRERERASNGAHLPIVAMTANAMQGDRERCLAAGMDGYVSKPVKPDELFAAISAAPGIKGKRLGEATAHQVLESEARVLPISKKNASTERTTATFGPVYNRAEVIQRLGGDEELFATLVGMYVADSPGYCTALEQALAKGDAPTLRREAHTVKGLFATFSDDSGTALALQVENLAKAGDLDAAGKLTPDLVIEVQRLAGALGHEIA